MLQPIGTHLRLHRAFPCIHDFSPVYTTSVVIAGLQKVYPIVAHQIDEAMLLCQPAGPNACPQMLQRFGFANPPERGAQNGFNEVEGAQRDPAVRGDPIA